MTQPSLLSPSGSSRRLSTWLAFGAMFAVSVALFLLVRSYGETLAAPPSPAGAAQLSPVAHSDVLAQVLLALAVIVVLASVVGRFVERRLKQPPVMGEILAGLMLGPSLLGALWPEAYQFLLPASAAPHLGVVAKIGVVLFMFLVGLELDPSVLRGNTHVALTISNASILAPFLLGAVLALALYPLYSQEGISFTVFSLFIGVSMSVTAFPVLARILTDRRIQSTALGVTALACAAVGDATAWCLLAFVSSVATAQLGNAGITVVLVVGYVAFMALALRPFTRWLSAREDRKDGPVSSMVLALVFGLLLLSAVATETIGIHALFGAFLFGVILPHDGRLARQLRIRMESLVIVLLLPIFFAFTGMRTEIGLVSGWKDWAFCLLIIAVATLGKFGGSFLAARFAGMGWRESSALGILMNTRGLMELIVLNVGLDMGVLSPTLFAMLVLMALVTTFSTTPILNWLLRGSGLEFGPAAASPISEEASRV